jgi:hypothetical protein
MPTIEILSQTHPEFDRERLLDLVALYRGGQCFTRRLYRFLVQNEYEPDTRYAKRVASARYFNYLGPIIDRFAAALIQVPPAIIKIEESAPDEFWKTWQSDVDGSGTDLSELARETITDALMKRRTFLVVEKPTGEAETEAEWKAKGLGNVRVRELETQHVIDWSCNEESGVVEWLIHHDIDRPRSSPLSKRNRVVETWTIYDAEAVSTYRLEYEEGNRPGIETEVPLVDRVPHGLGRIPVVVFSLSEGMWLAERAHDAQVENFTQRAALNWALKASCYAMPVFHLEDQNLPPVFGTGLGLSLGANDKIEWFAPPEAPFVTLSSAIESSREELYRIVHQMADGVSSAASMGARSAKSKQADLISTKTILETYAVVLRDALMRVVDLVAAMRGEDGSEFSVSGLDKFSDVDLADLFASVEKANSIGMPSEAYQLKARELMLDALMPQLAEGARCAILEEIKAGLGELKKKDELESQYQLALSHALVADAGRKGQGNAPSSAGGNGGSSASVPPKAKGGPPGKPVSGGAKPSGFGSGRGKG